jgi:hypothetical protein
MIVALNAGASCSFFVVVSLTTRASSLCHPSPGRIGNSSSREDLLVLDNEILHNAIGPAAIPRSFQLSTVARLASPRVLCIRSQVENQTELMLKFSVAQQWEGLAC